MTLTRKILVIISCLMLSTSADASGFIFKWDAFLVNSDLFINPPNSKSYMHDLPEVEKVAFFHHKGILDHVDSSASPEGLLKHDQEKKSFLQNVKITISPVDSALKNKKVIYDHGDDAQISHFIDALTSLIYDDEKSKSLETLGKIIEPQINLYFEF